MRSPSIPLLSALAFAFLQGLAAPAHAQLGISRFSIDGGGGSSAAGSFSSSGTAGQSDAGRLSGGAYVLTGGFWAGGGGGVSSVEDEDDGGAAPSAPPLVFQVYPPGPNPVGESMVVAFDLPEPRIVRAEIYDAGGRLVRVLANGLVSAGKNRRSWDRRDQNGNRVAPGVYFMRFDAGSDRTRHKIVVLH